MNYLSLTTMKLAGFIQRLHETPDSIEFSQCIELIDKNYHFIPTTFFNGKQVNESAENNGSCKIFAFGLLHKLTEQQTLACFGEFYRIDVLNNPDDQNHQNIRQFMLTGWQGIHFSEFPLKPK